MSKLGMCAETIPLRRSVEMAVEILEAMDESVVARKSVEIIKHYLREFRPIDVQSATTPSSSNDGTKIADFTTDPGAAAAASASGTAQTGFDIPVCCFNLSTRFMYKWRNRIANTGGIGMGIWLRLPRLFL